MDVEVLVSHLSLPTLKSSLQSGGLLNIAFCTFGKIGVELGVNKEQRKRHIICIDKNGEVG